MCIDWGRGWGGAWCNWKAAIWDVGPGIKGVGHGNGSSGDRVDPHIEYKERLMSADIQCGLTLESGGAFEEAAGWGLLEGWGSVGVENAQERDGGGGGAASPPGSNSSAGPG